MNREELKHIFSLEELQALGIGEIVYDISHRGGDLGFYGRDVAAALDIEAHLLPKKLGAYCNYLGGGVRRHIFTSDYTDTIEAEKTIEFLEELSSACARVYKNVEDDLGLNDTGDGDETNWEALTTKTVRDSA